MNGDNQPSEEPKQVKLKKCPAFNCPCIRDECEWYEQVAMMNPSMPAPQKVGMCIFKALFMVLATRPQAQPQIMKMPPGMMPPGLNPLRQ